MGLIAREIEQAGISTISLFNYRPFAECIIPPRTVNVDYPFGAQWGPPNAEGGQRRLVEDVLSALVEIQTPGTIIDLPYTWKDARLGNL